MTDNQIKGFLPKYLTSQAMATTDMFGAIRGKSRLPIKVNYQANENVGKFMWKHYATNMGYWLLRFPK